MTVDNTDQYRQLPDDEIITRIREGEINAFEWIVKRYETTVANIIYGIMGNIDNADDLGQEVFMRVYRGLFQFRFRASFKTYLTRIAINVCMDAIKKHGPFTVSLQSDSGLNERVGVDLQDERDIRELVHSALFQLEGDHRTVVVLRMLEGYSTRETAKLLRIPEGTVLSRLSRGLDKLREILIKDGYTPILDKTETL